MKVRFYRGPFGGKVVEYRASPGAVLIYRGPKRETREQKWKRMYDDLHNHYVGMALPTPTVEAWYRACERLVQSGNEFRKISLEHPDGSVFYEYIEGTRKEWQ